MFYDLRWGCVHYLLPGFIAKSTYILTNTIGATEYVYNMKTDYQNSVMKSFSEDQIPPDLEAFPAFLFQP